MKFTLHISVSNPRKKTKDEILHAIAYYLKRSGYEFNVGYDANELDIDSLGKA